MNAQRRLPDNRPAGKITGDHPHRNPRLRDVVVQNFMDEFGRGFCLQFVLLEATIKYNLLLPIAMKIRIRIILKIT